MVRPPPDTISADASQERSQVRSCPVSIHNIIAKQIVLPVYETGLPAKSDHFFTSASRMTSPLLRTTMAEKKHNRVAGVVAF